MIKSSNKLEALISIMDYGLVDTLGRIFKKNEIPVTLLSHGHGSARSIVYDILGYGGPKKVVSLSLQTQAVANKLMKQLNDVIDLAKPGTGIAFTISLSSMNNSLLATCGSSDENTEMRSEDMEATSKQKYHLIITIVNNGYFEEAMDAAKSAGATGGTMISARGLGSAEAVKYLGITIQPEKDLILILASDEDRNDIMKKITEAVGLKTPGMGVSFSLPVNNVVGVDKEPINIKGLK